MSRRKPAPVELPKGLEALKKLDTRIKEHPDVSVKDAEFDEVLAILGACSEGEYPHLIKCEVCPNNEECHKLEGEIGGNVWVKKGRKSE